MKNYTDREKILEIARKKLDQPGCGTDFPVAITHSITVAADGSDGSNPPTDAEQQAMHNGLVKTWRQQATAACAGNGDKCPDPHMIDYKPKDKGTFAPKGDGTFTWTIVATATTQCQNDGGSLKSKGTQVKKKVKRE